MPCSTAEQKHFFNIIIDGRTEQSEKVEEVKKVIQFFNVIAGHSREVKKYVFTLINSAAAARLYPCSVLSFTIGTWDTFKNLRDFWLWPWALL